jgi:hypothetical protein
MVLVAPAPASADLEWVPEGQFWVRYTGPIDGAPRSGPDANFELVTGLFGTRLNIWPGVSVRAVGELLSADVSRRPGDLRLGYGEWVTGTFGAFRGGQVPLFREAEDALLGDPILGAGTFSRAGFFRPAGLGGSWGYDLGISDATLSVELAGTYTEGLLGSGALATASLQPVYDPAIQGPGPAAHGRVRYRLPDGLQADVFGRYGLVEDQQIAVALSQRLWDSDLLGTVGASASTPAGLPAATDIAAAVRIRYNLANVTTDWWRTDVVLKTEAISRNITGAISTDPRIYTIAAQRFDLRTTAALFYRIADATLVGVDLSEDRAISPTATSSLFLGVRTGVRF